MQVHIFRAAGRIFCFTEDEAGANLPADLDDYTFFKTIPLTRGATQAGVNVEECLDDIAQYGFHVTDAHVRITDRYVGSDR